MGSRPIASFATAAGAALAPNPVAPPASFAGGLAEANPGSGVPRAMIPLMEELGVGSGVGSDYSAANGFDLAAAPAQPMPQKFPFESGSSFPGGYSPGAMPAGSGRGAESGGEVFVVGGGAGAALPRPGEKVELDELGGGTA